jgi:hypothetical protein
MAHQRSVVDAFGLDVNSLIYSEIIYKSYKGLMPCMYLRRNSLVRFNVCQPTVVYFIVYSQSHPLTEKFYNIGALLRSISQYFARNLWSLFLFTQSEMRSQTWSKTAHGSKLQFSLDSGACMAGKNYCERSQPVSYSQYKPSKVSSEC